MRTFAAIARIIVPGLCVAAAGAAAFEVVVTPESPTIHDVVEIRILGCGAGGVLHWGVNSKGNQWEKAIEAYWPPASREEGVATRSPLEGPDGAGACSVRLGPFDRPEQQVGSVDFVIQWADGSWENSDGRDYHIGISQGRISVRPPAPALNDRVEVTVHRSREGGRLHWGVNSEFGHWKPPHKRYWPEGTRRAENGLAVDTPLPPPDAQGDSVITLGPFNLGEQVVRRLHFAVRWDEDWDTDLGRNYNVPVRLDSGPESAAVSIVSPTNGAILSGGLTVTALVERADSVSLWLDGRPLMTLVQPPFVHEVPVADLEYGRHVLVARTAGGEGVGMQEIEFWSVPAVVPAAYPGELPLGATVMDDGTVLFALFAPGKYFVSVVGDFNGWQPLADLMSLAPDGTWWLRRPVEPGRHLYQYVIEGRQRLADPWSGDVDWRDAIGQETWAAEHAKSVLEVGQVGYTWSERPYQRPPLDQLIIYEFHLDDLCPGQGFTGVIARLDYIRDLGVTAIEPLPITEFPHAWSWGYNPAFHFAPESAYGTPDEARRLVDEAHRRGLAVITDLVLNHMDWNAPLLQLYGLDYDTSPYFRLFLGDNWGFPDLDQPSPAVKRYTADLLRHWLTSYRVDGFRYDATRWVGWQGYNDWGASWFAYAARQADPGSYQIAEHLPSDPELMRLTEMDTGWDCFFRWRMRDFLRGGWLDRNDFQTLVNPRLQGFERPTDRVPYTESHDEERVMREMREAGYASDEAVRRCVSALALTLTAPGVPMVYAGQEFGEETAKIVWRNPLHWEKLKQPEGRAIHQSFQALGRLRRDHPALRTESVEIVSEGMPEQVGCYRRENAGRQVTVAVNFGRTPQTVSIPVAKGRWVDILKPKRRGAGKDGLARLDLLPGESAVVTSGPRSAQ
jgi:1,4-alpha-glucan branching enzyme